MYTVIVADDEEQIRRALVKKMDWNQLGFELTDAWATIYGDCPQILVTALLPDELEAERRMAQNDWHVLIDQLEGYVTDLEMKLVPAANNFQF